MSGRADAAGDERFGVVLALCIEANERGDWSAYEQLLAEYPEFAEELSGFFTCRERLDQITAPLRLSGLEAELTQQVLGDYRLIREIGRGGMGVVYEARQQSLHRRVALKILPLTAVLDVRRLQRFKNEALAAAQLDHPHIVRVLSVGCERGIHYYAMDYIDGLSLAEVIQAARTDAGATERTGRTSGSSARPGSETAAALSTLRSRHRRDFFRRVAELGIQAGEALDCAHELGLVHRDVKPSNLLLDQEGRLYVTDFGLATTQNDASLTLTGDLLGTLRYMSPEQASGRRSVVDRRTDIYSLGTSLYELATLQPAFAEVDRARLLQQIIVDPPPRPSRVDAAIPADLETIILKAMAKDPADRYSTARELVDDIRRHLSDRPILARRPNPLQRLAGWSRRHRALVVSGVTVLCLSVLILSVSNVLIVRQRNLARDAATEANRQRTRAETRLRQARTAVDMFTRLAEELADRPQMEQLQRESLERALDFYQAFLQEESNDPELRLETAQAQDRMAEIYRTLGDFAKCVEHSRAHHKILSTLQRDFPDEPRYRELLAQNFARLGDAMLHRYRLDESQAYSNDALNQWQQLAADYPENPSYRKEVAAWHLNSLSRRSKADWADPSTGAARARKGLFLLDELERDFPQYPEDLELRASGHRLLGMYLVDLLDFKQAETHLRKACQLHDRGAEYNLAKLLLMRGEIGEAKMLTQRMITGLQEQREEHPDLRLPNSGLIALYGLLVDVDIAEDKWDDAADAARHSLQLVAEWEDRWRENRERNTKNLAWHQYRLADALYGAGEMEEARETYQQAISLFGQFAQQFPEFHRPHSFLAFVLSTCPAKQLRDPSRASWHAEQALKLVPDNPDYWVTLATTQNVSGDPAAAIVSMQQAEMRYQGRLPIGGKLILAMAHNQLGDLERARRIYQQAIDELADKDTYSHWYTMEFRVLQSDADRMFAAGP